MRLFLAEYVAQYEYSDEDFCLFKNFPHYRFVVAIFYYRKKRIKCSCLTCWLTKHYNLYQNELKELNNSYPFAMSN